MFDGITADEFAVIGDDEEIRAILMEACALTGMRFSALAFVSDTRWIACQVADTLDFGLAPGGELDVRKTICDEIREYGETVVIDDANADPDWWGHPVPILYGFRSYASLPIRLSDGRFFGTLCALDPDPRGEPLDGRLEGLKLLADRVSAILDRRLAERSASGR